MARNVYEFLRIEIFTPQSRLETKRKITRTFIEYCHRSLPRSQVAAAVYKINMAPFPMNGAMYHVTRLPACLQEVKRISKLETEMGVG